MITKFGVKCKVEELISNTLLYLAFGTPTAALLYAMYLQSGGKPFIEDLWLLILKIF